MCVCQKRRSSRKIRRYQKNNSIFASPKKSYLQNKSLQTIIGYYRRYFKRKILNLKIAAEKQLSKPFLFLIEHYKIKDDFLEIYESHVAELFNNPNLKNRTYPDKEQWFKRAQIFEEQSITIDPHQKISKFLTNLSEIYEELDNKYSKLLNIVSFLIIVFGGSSLLSFFNFITSTILPYSCLLFAVFLIIGAYLYLLKIDTDFFHIINKKLRFSTIDLFRIKRTTRTDKSKIITATIWNCSLTDYRTTSRIFILLIFKMFTAKIYKKIFFGLKTILPKYLEELTILTKEKDYKKIRRLIFEAMKETPNIDIKPSSKIIVIKRILSEIEPFWNLFYLFLIGIFCFGLFLTPLIPDFLCQFTITQRTILSTILSLLIATLLVFFGYKANKRFQYFYAVRALLQEMKRNRDKMQEFQNKVTEAYNDCEKIILNSWIAKLPSYTNWGDGDNFHLKYLPSQAYVNFINNGYINQPECHDFPATSIAHFYQFCIEFSKDLQKLENEMRSLEKGRKSPPIKIDLIRFPNKKFQSSKEICSFITEEFYPFYAGKNDFNDGILLEYNNTIKSLENHAWVLPKK